MTCTLLYGCCITILLEVHVHRDLHTLWIHLHANHTNAYLLPGYMYFLMQSTYPARVMVLCLLKSHVCVSACLSVCYRSSEGIARFYAGFSQSLVHAQLTRSFTTSI